MSRDPGTLLAKQSQRLNARGNGARRLFVLTYKCRVLHPIPSMETQEIACRVLEEHVLEKQNLTGASRFGRLSMGFL